MGMQWRLRIALAVVSTTATMASAQIDDRMARVNDGTSPRVFAIDIAPDQVVALTGATEVRQERPPHNYAVLVQNQGRQTIGSATVTLAVVLSDGTVRAFQELPAIKSLKPGQSRRQETRVRTAVLSPTDRIAFVLKTLSQEGGPPPWQATDDELRRVIREMAKRVPVP